jgi:NTE family protein
MKALVLSGGSSHGAFQAGAIMALDDLGWTPDIIFGSSVGAINGVAYAAGMSGRDLSDLWQHVTNEKVYSWRPVWDWFSIFKWNYLFDTSPLKSLLQDRIEISMVQRSPITALVSGLDIQTGSQRIFSSRLESTREALKSHYPVSSLDHDSLLASAALPGIFPEVRGMWDGAYQQRHPLKPVILMGATEILVVHLNVPDGNRSIPKGPLQIVLRLAEMASSYHLLGDLKALELRNHMEGYRPIELKVVCPEKPLGYSRLDFNRSHKKYHAIRSGYHRTMEAFET